LQRELAGRVNDRRGRIRGRILAAAYGLISERGFAHVSLTDLASAVDMSPSHLLYYFDSKDTVLEELFEYCSQRMLRDVLALRRETAAEECQALVGYFFGGTLMTPRDQSFLLEIFGLATHHPRLRRTKTNYDAQIRACFEGLFRRTPRLAGLSPEDAAEIALAAVSGLITGAYFDETLDARRSGALFHAVLRHLAGLDAPVAAGSNELPAAVAKTNG